MPASWCWARMFTVPGVKGGTNGATRGIEGPVPDRVLGTPISEECVFRAWPGGASRWTGEFPADR